MGYYSEVSILCGRNVAKRLVELPTLFGGGMTKTEHPEFDSIFRNVA